MSSEEQALCPSCESALPDPPADFCQNCRFPLIVIAGKYRLESLLNEGGYSHVYLARHIRLERNAERVIKIIKSELLQQEPSMEKRFYREVQMTADLSLRNQHVVRVFDDFGEQPKLGHYYVMEYLQGITLAEHLAQTEGPLPIEEALHIFAQLCDAINAAHQEDVIHRDLKPANMMLVNYEDDPLYLKVLDFGIAKSFAEESVSHKQHTQGAIGTPTYMAPEHFTGGKVDNRTDLYSMGILLYELLAGKPPFIREKTYQSPMIEMMDYHLKMEPPPIRRKRAEIPQALEDVVMKALEKRPEARFQSVTEFKEALLTVDTSTTDETAPAPATPVASQQELPAVQPPAGRPEIPPAAPSGPKPPPPSPSHAQLSAVPPSPSSGSLTALPAAAKLPKDASDWDPTKKPLSELDTYIPTPSLDKKGPPPPRKSKSIPKPGSSGPIPAPFFSSSSSTLPAAPPSSPSQTDIPAPFPTEKPPKRTSPTGGISLRPDPKILEGAQFTMDPEAEPLTLDDIEDDSLITESSHLEAEPAEPLTFDDIEEDSLITGTGRGTLEWGKTTSVDDNSENAIETPETFEGTSPREQTPEAAAKAADEEVTKGLLDDLLGKTSAIPDLIPSTPVLGGTLPFDTAIQANPFLEQQPVLDENGQVSFVPVEAADKGTHTDPEEEAVSLPETEEASDLTVTKEEAAATPAEAASLGVDAEEVVATSHFLESTELLEDKDKAPPSPFDPPSEEKSDLEAHVQVASLDDFKLVDDPVDLEKDTDRLSPPQIAQSGRDSISLDDLPSFAVSSAGDQEEDEAEEERQTSPFTSPATGTPPLGMEAVLASGEAASEPASPPKASEDRNKELASTAFYGNLMEKVNEHIEQKEAAAGQETAETGQPEQVESAPLQKSSSPFGSTAAFGEDEPALQKGIQLASGDIGATDEYFPPADLLAAVDEQEKAAPQSEAEHPPARPTDTGHDYKSILGEDMYHQAIPTDMELGDFATEGEAKAPSANTAVTLDSTQAVDLMAESQASTHPHKDPFAQYTAAPEESLQSQGSAQSTGQEPDNTPFLIVMLVGGVFLLIAAWMML